MSEIKENTLSAYLGPEFQQKLLWQLLVEPEFAEKTLPNLTPDYFDDPNIKRLFVFMKDFQSEFEKVPNLQNQSIHQAINRYKNPNNLIEEETLFGVLKRIELWNERVINKDQLHDGDVVQKSTNEFIKQQEYRKLGEFILMNTKTGGIKTNKIIGVIEERILKITSIGEDEDFGTEVIENIDTALRKEFRQTIPTGVKVIDDLAGGGLGKSEIGIILAPSGVGKSTLLSKIANTAYDDGKNVLQIIFEDTEDQIKRKHYAIWSKVPLSEIDENLDHVKELVKEKAIQLTGRGGRLIIKRFSQENTTMLDIRNWVTRYQKKFGYKFDIVILDYLDCLESHRRSGNLLDDELTIVKSFESFAGDFNIPAWTAVQGNRSSFNAEFVEIYQTGGNIKRVQKAHFFMSIAKTADQQEANTANIRILKARFAKAGHTFEDCIFNNDTMEIRIEDEKYGNSKVVKGLKKHDEAEVTKFNATINNLDDKMREEMSTNIDIDDNFNSNVDISDVDFTNKENNDSEIDIENYLDKQSDNQDIMKE